MTSGDTLFRRRKPCGRQNYSPIAKWSVNVPQSLTSDVEPKTEFSGDVNIWIRVQRDETVSRDDQSTTF